MEIKADVDAVLVGRILAAVIVVLSLAYSIKAATSDFSDGFWTFLAAILVPLAVAFLIVMVTEVLRELRQRGEQDSS